MPLQDVVLLLRFTLSLIRTSKILMRLNVLNFLKAFDLKMFLFCSYVCEADLPVKCENYYWPKLYMKADGSLEI